MYILLVVMPVCSQPAQAVTGKETFASVKAAGTYVNDGGISYSAQSRGIIMALSHKFKDSNDFLQGGVWFDDDHKICEWVWDASVKKLNIKCGIHDRKIDLSNFEKDKLTEKNLSRTLPMLALETAEEINNIKYEL